ncbi:hypothetical protein MRX96_054383 [Rhipicephalus microplus]
MVAKTRKARETGHDYRAVELARLLVHWLRLAHLARQPQKSSNKTAGTGTLLRFARRLASLILLTPSSLSHCCCVPPKRRLFSGPSSEEWFAGWNGSREQQVLSLIAATRPCPRTLIRDP